RYDGAHPPPVRRLRAAALALGHRHHQLVRQMHLPAAHHAFHRDARFPFRGRQALDHGRRHPGEARLDVRNKKRREIGSSTMSAPKSVIGRSLPRLEDPPLVTGRGLFAGDVSFAHQLHMRVVRSTCPHGRIVAIDTAAARAAPGVVAVWTHADVADVPPIDFRLTRVEGLEPYRQPILAHGHVRYVGEPVAAVFAADPYLAEDAADLVAIAYDELPALLAADAPPAAFSAGCSTEVTLVQKGFGDVDAAFAKAHAVVALDLAVGRHSGVPLETRGAIAREHRGILELHGVAKVLHWNRDSLARMLGRPPSSMHLHEGHVGGGFGVRGELYPEDVLVCLAALRLKRPVKWIEDRREHLLATNHSRQQRF